MPDYQQMYIELFRRVTLAINDLEEAQRQTEEMYIQAEMKDLRFVHGDGNTKLVAQGKK